MIKKLLYLIFLAVPMIANGQSNSHDSASGLGHGEVFNPFRENPKDSTKKDVIVPEEIHQWKVEREFGKKIEKFISDVDCLS